MQEEQLDVKAITKDELEQMDKYERRDAEEEASRYVEKMDRAEREALEKSIREACDEYGSAINEAISTAGEQLAGTMRELRQQYGTLVVDAVLDDNSRLDDLNVNEDIAHNIAEVEEEHQYSVL